MAAFDPDEFVASCLDALDEGPRAPAAVRELLGRAVSDPGALGASVVTSRRCPR